jgi:TonB-linked SusC/RagA family outer membrane protein
MSYRIFFTGIKKWAVLTSALVIAVITSVSAQDTLTVRGNIVNGRNQPVSGVSVGVEGSFELPVVTNDAGEFTVKTISGEVWLNIEPTTGYKTKRVYLNNRTDLTIYLTREDMESGNDQITLFSRDFLKRDFIPASSTLSPDNILFNPSLTVDQYMQGRVSGMHVVNRSGSQETGAVTMLRGMNSLNLDSRPLYVVDGFPITSMGVFSSNLEGFEYNPLLVINPLDISKITVIKDATLAAAYGSKASNGVVLIETLDPSATQTVIELDMRSGYSLAPETHIPLMNAGQHKTLISELLFSSGRQEERIREDYPNLFLTEEDDRFIDYQHNTNWQDMIFSNTFFNNLNINVKGGDEIARYGLSFGYVNSNGIIKNTGYDGYNLKFVGLLNIFTWLKMNAGVTMNYSNSDMKESARMSETNPILASLSKSPMLHPWKYDDLGQQLNILQEVDELGVSNPLAIIDNYEARNNNFNFTTTLGFIVNINQNMDFHTNFGLNYNILKEKIFMPNKGMAMYFDGQVYNVAKATNNTLTSLYFNNYLSYNINFGDNHSFTSITGINTLNNKFELDWALTKNSHENDEYRMLQDGTGGLWEIGGANRLWNWASFYETLTYGFKDKYLAMATLSVDGSSRIGENAINTLKIGGIPFGIFYSLGAAWRISNESVFKNWSALEELKFRITYGQTGNDDIGESTATKYYRTVKFRETTGIYPALVPNDELSYEMVSQLNGGIDISLFGNRITTNIDVYKSMTDNLLIFAPLEAYFGYNFRPENNGKMENSGFELNQFVRIVDRSKFKWDIQASYSLNKNKIIEIKGNKLVSNVLGGEIVNMVGEQANSFYGYIYEGVYATTEEAVAKNLMNERMVPYQAGDAIYQDISGPNGTKDGIINDYDKVVIGSSMPDLFGGITNAFEYGRWGLSAFVQYVKGNEVFNYIRYQNENMVGIENQSTRVLNRWQYEGQVTDIPRAVLGDLVGNSALSTRWIEDGSYLRVKNITLSYTIPEEFLTFRNAQFYISANNLITFSDYLGYDPEFGHSQGQADQGIDYGLTPQPRMFIMGIKLGL